MAFAPSALPAPSDKARRRRVLLWGSLIGLLLVAQSLLVVLTLAYENNRAQEQVDAVAAQAVADIKRNLSVAVQELQVLTWDEETEAAQWGSRARAQVQRRRDLVRIEQRDIRQAILVAIDSPLAPTAMARRMSAERSFEADAACAAAQRASTPVLSASYFVPIGDGLGREVIDLCLPRLYRGQATGFVVASFILASWLEDVVPPGRGQSHEMSFVESDGARLARAGAPRGSGIYRVDRVVDLPGRSLQLRVDSSAGRPSIIPNITVAMVLGLSLALLALAVVLARDGRRRANAEQALAEALAFRKAMEDSLSTGLRARDLQGRITYVNPAFCAMVGYSADELVGPASGVEPVAAHQPDPVAPPLAPVQPYWPPEQVNTYVQRQQSRLAQAADDAKAGSREGFETLFMRRNGERFPVMIYEAPLVDGQGRHTGWMGAVVDVSGQRRVEELSRQQQERLQASARLATMGEMASLLSHELNQPLSAIASYATGSLNLVEQADAQTPQLLRQALSRIAEQAERAGRVIKSVHDFVRRREHHHEAISAEQLFEAALPLIRLQARKSGTRIDLDLPAQPLWVRCDRTMLEQVLLNLARNAIQAMEEVPLEQRVLRLSAERESQRGVRFTVTDQGVGIPVDVAGRLFTPFYTTRAEGMGLGLSLCRTVIEQHGGQLEFDSPWPAGSASGCRFRFTLAAVQASRGSAREAEATEPDTRSDLEAP
jgi:two-component system, LuxR family, sensor histidine kinase DctS